MWDGTRSPAANRRRSPISIHPSRVGWDWMRLASRSPASTFQSTHPVWDGTKKLSGTGATVAISIHPSRVGWDADVWDFARRYGKFQSTHPVWDGTRRQGDRMHARQHFNPPIPCGMGLPSCPCTSAVDHFNPPIPCGMGRIYIVKSLAGFLFQSTHPVWDGTCS